MNNQNKHFEVEILSSISSYREVLKKKKFKKWFSQEMAESIKNDIDHIILKQMIETSIYFKNNI